MVMSNRDRINAQGHEIDELKETIKTLTKQLDAVLNPPAPEPEVEEEFIYPDGLKRDGQGRILTNPDAPSYDEQLAARIEREDAQREAHLARRSAGLPEGQFRDPCGIIRWEKDGRTVASTSGDDADQATGIPGLTEEQLERRDTIHDVSRRLRSND